MQVLHITNGHGQEGAWLVCHSRDHLHPHRKYMDAFIHYHCCIWGRGGGRCKGTFSLKNGNMSAIVINNVCNNLFFSLNVGNIWEYFVKYCQSHRTLLWIWMMLCCNMGLTQRKKQQVQMWNPSKYNIVGTKETSMFHSHFSMGMLHNSI